MDEKCTHDFRLIAEGLKDSYIKKEKVLNLQRNRTYQCNKCNAVMTSKEKMEKKDAMSWYSEHIEQVRKWDASKTKITL